MVFYHSRRKATKTDISTMKWDIAVTGVSMLSFGGLWKTMGLWTRKVIEHCKQAILTGAWKTVVQRAVYTMKAKLKKFQRKTILVIGDYSCGILANNIAPFYPCTEILPKAKSKNMGKI